MFSSTLGRFAALATLVAGSLTMATFSIAQPPAGTAAGAHHAAVAAAVAYRQSDDPGRDQGVR